MTRNNASSSSSSSSSSSNNSPQDRQVSAEEFNKAHEIFGHIADNNDSFPLRSLIEEYSGPSSFSLDAASRPLENSRVPVEYKEGLKNLLMQCFDPTTNTLNLTSAQDQNPPLQEPSAADILAQDWREAHEAGEGIWALAEKSIQEAFALAMAEIRQDNPQARLENINVSENLNATYIPNALTNVEGLAIFNCSFNRNLKEIETSATNVTCGGCTSLTRANFPRATYVNCGRCINLATADFPRATNVNCYQCPHLTTDNFPSAPYPNPYGYGSDPYGDYYLNNLTTANSQNSPATTVSANSATTLLSRIHRAISGCFGR